MNAADLGIDLGTSSILVYVRGKGVVLKEPSVVAFDKDTNRIKAIGEEARMMLGRTPGNIVAIRPLRKGVISDYTITEHMLKYFIQKSLGRMSVPQAQDQHLCPQRHHRGGEKSGGGCGLPGGSQRGGRSSRNPSRQPSEPAWMFPVPAEI